MNAAAIAHGGVGTEAVHSDGCRVAVEAALAALSATNDPLDAAVAGVVVLEDDQRFNAGTGSIVRLDGSVQMDASVMDSAGRFGAVASIERVKNPVLVARAVLDTPHLVLAGDGATQFARTLEMPDHDPATPASWPSACAPARTICRPSGGPAPGASAGTTPPLRKTRASPPTPWGAPCARPTDASAWPCPPEAPPSCCAAGWATSPSSAPAST